MIDTTSNDNSGVAFSSMSLMDDVGRLFMEEGRCFRAIRKDAIEQVMEFVEGGLLDKLVARGLFPETWITERTLPGYDMVVEHRMISPITYPREWTFGMLKDVALTVLDINRIASEFGYQLKDCHPNNVVFDRTRPVFVDLGSFVKTSFANNSWLAYERFFQSYVYPLYFWSTGNNYIAVRMLVGSESGYVPHESYLLYKYSLLRLLPTSLIRSVAASYFKFRTLSTIESARIKRKIPGMLGESIVWLKDRGWLPFQGSSRGGIRRRVERVRRKSLDSRWGTYHQRLYKEFEGAGSEPRFDRILRIIKDLDIKSVTELAGNQGMFSMLILRKTKAQRIVCTDYDECAVDILYAACRESGDRITPAVLDFMKTMSVDCELPPRTRFISEAAIALAVTHHLLLTQNMPVEYVLKKIADFAERYVFIEFMPLGLYDRTGPVSTPDWYTVDWFRESFKERFDLVLEEQLEDNRILFVGRLDSS